MPKALNLTGLPFHRWTVLERHGLSRDKKVLWKCRCVCGAIGYVTSGNLTRGVSRQCRECADNCADHGSPRAARPGQPRRCDHCGCEYLPRRSRSKYCSSQCRAGARWAEISADPAKKAWHSRRVTANAKAKSYVQHAACASCGRSFFAPPTRLHCSRECLDETIRGGKYRNAFHRRRVEAEAATLTSELNRRLDEK